MPADVRPGERERFSWPQPCVGENGYEGRVAHPPSLKQVTADALHDRGRKGLDGSGAFRPGQGASPRGMRLTSAPHGKRKCGQDLSVLGGQSFLRSFLS